ncbi:TetR/AcrR family transcriptional regulator [Luteipulveratus mongoliensis]|uniref:TetR family transcriptional regulator n=1 Tax=Luteipulveratus mongoliensis TaxID=571913 RepID=A0A0K1JH14_9MICO|nr:TetR/AcrR family transcriptional regulator [Luteipulveratus mongoliensis]AKU16004.1 TetR family transcriptional regulator [Luteipulveratus mongoliensis]
MTTEQGRGGRPRSEQARAAVLHAVDDLLLEVGYSAMTMKGIAERAGVSRQTVYRWWSTKAEILFEASAIDAEQELAVRPAGDPVSDLAAYLDALGRFLAESEAGASYRALLGEAQHDAAVAQLLGTKDVIGDSARTVIDRAVPHLMESVPADRAVARLVGPTFFWILSGRSRAELVAQDLAAAFVAEIRADAGPSRGGAGAR